MIEGVLGIDADPLTLRALLWRLEGWRREQWKHTSALMWAIFQCQTPKSVPLDRFNPYAQAKSGKPGTPVTPASIGLLKRFVDDSGGPPEIARVEIYRENGTYKARIAPQGNRLSAGWFNNCVG
jgi:hypothetical protein